MENDTHQESSLEVVPRENGQALQRQPQQRSPVPIGNRGLQLNNLEALWRFSGYVANSGLAPKGIEKQESIFVAVQMGLEVGLTPMAALQNIAVINGRPSLWGDAQLGVVRASGTMEAYNEEETNDELHVLFVSLCLERDERKRNEMQVKLSMAQAKLNRAANDYGFSVHTKREGERDRFNRFSIADARVAGLWGKTGPWTNYPSRMLKFRARSFLLRDVYGDALKGLLSAEEISDTPAEGPRFGSVAKRVSESTVTDITPVAEAKPAPTETNPVQPTQEAPSKPIQTQSVQQQLMELIRAAGYSFVELMEWAVQTGQIETAVADYDSIPAERAGAWIKAKKGLLTGLAAARKAGE